MRFGWNRLRSEWRPTLSLAVPVVLAELGWMGMGVVDLVMVGRVSPEAIGGVGIGRALFMSLTVFGMGLLLGLDTLVSQDWGRGRIDECRSWLLHGVYVSTLVAVPLASLVFAGLPLLDRWGMDDAVLRATRGYLIAINWSCLPLLLYTTFRRYLQAVGRVRPVMIALVSANVVNVFANWVLIFGKLGAPAMGAAGAGWASLASSAYLACLLAAACAVHGREEAATPLRGRWRPEAARLRRLFGLGLPAAMQLVLEVGVFAVATALAGLLEPAWLAAHQIALTAASVTYMVPLGIASAGAVRVGQALGRADADGAARSGWMALLLGGGSMTVAALVFLVLPRPIVRLFSSDPAVVAAGVALLFVAAFFQLFDGLQVVATGALRGAGNTRTPLLWNLVGHWLLGLPIGYGLCFVAGWGAIGLWTGWLVGLTLVGIVLVVVWGRTAASFGAHAPPSTPGDRMQRGL